uniref:Uncharacterized protein n=1 Tax=Pseudochlorodesmis sp. HV01306b TaxID=2358489 RepID=A0A386AY99_9CHLO|nr:hypothetical protein [Pseudochlorodesmis sp. HV01306b]
MGSFLEPTYSISKSKPTTSLQGFTKQIETKFCDDFTYNTTTKSDGGYTLSSNDGGSGGSNDGGGGSGFGGGSRYIVLVLLGSGIIVIGKILSHYCYKLIEYGYKTMRQRSFLPK